MKRRSLALALAVVAAILFVGATGPVYNPTGYIQGLFRCGTAAAARDWLGVAGGIDGDFQPASAVLTNIVGIGAGASGEVLWHDGTRWTNSPANPFQATNANLSLLQDYGPTTWQATNAALTALAGNANLYQATNAALTALNNGVVTAGTHTNSGAGITFGTNVLTATQVDAATLNGGSLALTNILSFPGGPTVGWGSDNPPTAAWGDGSLYLCTVGKLFIRTNSTWVWMDPVPSGGGTGPVTLLPNTIDPNYEIGLSAYAYSPNELPGVTNIVLNVITNRDWIDFEGCPDLVTFTANRLVRADGDQQYFQLSQCPNLVSFEATNLVSIRDVAVCENAGLLSIDLRSLTSAMGRVIVHTCTSLTNLDLSALTTVGGSFDAYSCTSLTNISCPVWLPTTGKVISFAGCALDVSVVNLILARAVASGMTSGTIDLSGGTSAAPTGQGIIDKAALIAAGVTVTTN
jgi:hypothetical protein